jgi:hypothetical protein
MGGPSRKAFWSKDIMLLYLSNWAQGLTGLGGSRAQRLISHLTICEDDAFGGSLLPRFLRFLPLVRGFGIFAQAKQVYLASQGFVHIYHEGMKS